MLNKPYLVKYRAITISGNFSTYLTIQFSMETTNRYTYWKFIVRIRSSIREVYLYTNDNTIYAKGVTIVENGFINEIKFSNNQKTLYIKVANYAGQPTFYLERSDDSFDEINVSNIIHSTTPYTLPSDAKNI